MRKICVLIISLFCINTLYAQTASYKSVRKNKLSGTLDTYITKSGDWVSIGDQIIIGEAYQSETYRNLKIVKNYKEITNYAGHTPLRGAAKGYVLIIYEIIADNGIIRLYTRTSDNFFQVLVKNIEAAEFYKEIVFGPPSKKYPYIKENEVIGYYTSSKFSPLSVYYDKVITDSLIIEEIKTKQLGTKDSIPQSIAYNFEKYETNSSFYLKKAGKSKNASIVVMGLTGLIGGASLFLDDPGNPSATPIFAVGGIVSLILNVVGNNALIKAGDAMELEKIKQFEAKKNQTVTPKP